jgi:hypothetical protein
MKRGTTMKGEMRIMGPRGDERLAWDTEVQETVEAAATTFARLLLSGHVGFVTSGKETGKLEAFDPEAERIVMTMPMAGG